MAALVPSNLRYYDENEIHTFGTFLIWIDLEKTGFPPVVVASLSRDDPGEVEVDFRSLRSQRRWIH